ncbi:alpha-amylase family glycosyl hydrolase [Hoylesella saccharolytica]|uniref:alpha-amylase family glycosyl hydrolase n=1 Tax=Hoylesella saccharolytica TaxID=633701 RepID=UPI0028E9F1D8|nr:alpha-amylase family glycosyl hydrolase [Hoylesella saccharolytica]
MNKKLIIYQVLPRLFGNRNLTRKEGGTIVENGCGKLNDFDTATLRRIRNLGITHIWFTGIIRHATQTDYSSFGIPRQHVSIVKGEAGSPYAIADYYDVMPDLAMCVDKRMEEWEQLVHRTHEAGMKVILDFVPNHVAREYRSIVRPVGVKDLGEDDDVSKRFSPQNDFYYCCHQSFEPEINLTGKDGLTYQEFPAKATGNDRFDNHPGINDWYETIKLNYGVDYCDAGGRSDHFNPVPDTWIKMVDILLFWAAKGVDGFRCDMAEMVPPAFWAYATQIVTNRYPDIIFIGEVYDPSRYRTYIQSGFTYLYDKVGMYDCVRGVMCGERPASSITYEWQLLDDISDRMLYFLENHDEQRIASDFFCGDAWKGVPGLLVSALMQRNPLLIYAGQEFGEPGMDKEGYSGRDGRTTIFDYWALETLYRGYFNREALRDAELHLSLVYQQILRIANRERAISEGQFFDLMYVNSLSERFNPRQQFAFLRKFEDEVLLVVANFSAQPVNVGVTIPAHAFQVLDMPEKEILAVDLLTGDTLSTALKKDDAFYAEVPAHGGRIYKFSTKMNYNGVILNEHNKDEFPPAHTAEHLLNQVMLQLFGCERSTNAHIERRKSKMSFVLDHKPTRQEEKQIEQRMNEQIEADLPVTYELVNRYQLPDDVDADRLPADSSDVIRLVRIGNFDVCPCIGKHVRSTSQIGKFVMLGTNWDENTRTFRVRFKIV